MLHLMYDRVIDLHRQEQMRFAEQHRQARAARHRAALRKARMVEDHANHNLNLKLEKAN